VHCISCCPQTVMALSDPYLPLHGKLSFIFIVNVPDNSGAWNTYMPSFLPRHLNVDLPNNYTKARDTLSSRHLSSHKTYVLFSTPSLSLPMRWLSYDDLYNLMTWCHIKKVRWRTFFDKHFLHFWKQLVTSEERSTRTSRLTKCVRQQKFERRADTSADQSSTRDHVS